MSSDAWSPAAWRGSAFNGFRDLLDGFATYDRWPRLDEYEQFWLTRLNVVTAKGMPLRLVEQAPKSRRAKPRSRDALYDISVVAGALPTRRENWHDFFNVMMFAAFPDTKRALHGRHSQILEAGLPSEVTRLPGTRTEQQDCLTILDEGGVVLAVEPHCAEAVTAVLDNGLHEPLTALVRRGLVRPWLLGHAHLEHLVRCRGKQHLPLPSAKSVVLCCGAGLSRPELDVTLAARVSQAEFCSTRDRRRPIALEALFLDLAQIG